MEVIEVSAPTLEAAKQSAAEKLGVSADTLAVTVLEESKGLFGKGSVRIRAEAGSSSDGGAAETAKPKRGRASKKEMAPEVEAQPEQEAAAEAADVPEAEPAEKPTRRGRAAKAKEEKPAEKEEKPAAKKASDEETAAAEVVATQKDADALLGLLNGILDAGDLEVSAKVSDITGRYVNLVIDGKDAGHLVGKQGEVINALQYLLNIIANQQIGNGVRATLDGNDYRQRREAALTKLANTIADHVVQRGEEAVLDALPAFERRVVHKALSENPKVSTYSEGEEPNRRVVIAPAE
jgi:spoIIIJ-associated protein